MGKSSLILDISVSEPNPSPEILTELENKIKSIKMPGLQCWGAVEVIPVAYGLVKLRIISTIEDELSVDDLTEQISEADEENIRSVTIFAFNKI
jgi:translation elongation factor EF-1beta